MQKALSYPRYTVLGPRDIGVDTVIPIGQKYIEQNKFTDEYNSDVEGHQCNNKFVTYAE